MYLLDTVTLSALRRNRRDPALVDWIERQRPSDLFISVVSIGEMERGIARKISISPDFAAALGAWLDRLLSLYESRILPFNLSTARRWGALSAALGNESVDLMMAATAFEHGLTVVTRNVTDFEPTGVPVVNPFSRSNRR
jgi:toxin FitB